MEEVKTNVNGGSSKEFLLKKLRPIFAVFAFLFVLSAIVVPICVAFHADAALYTFTILASLGLIATVYLMIRMVLKYSKELENSLKVMDEQLDDFSHGDIKLLSLHHYLPTIDK